MMIKCFEAVREFCLMSHAHIYILLPERDGGESDSPPHFVYVTGQPLPRFRSDNNIGPDGATDLAAHLERLTNLQSLDLRYERQGFKDCVMIKGTPDLKKIQ